MMRYETWSAAARWEYVGGRIEQDSKARVAVLKKKRREKVLVN